MRRAAQKARTRQTILDAARAAFADGLGIELPVAAIARRAGVATGTFYVHFPSKDALIAALLEEFNASFAARLREVSRGGCAAPEDDGIPGLHPRDGADAVARGPAIPLQPAAGASAGTGLREVWPGPEALAAPETLVTRLAGTCLDFWMEHRALLEVFLRRAAASGDLRALREGIAPPVADFLRRGLETLAGLLGVALKSPRLVVHGLLGMWTRIGLLYLFSDDVDRDEAVDTLSTLSLGAVRAVVPLPT